MTAPRVTIQSRKARGGTGLCRGQKRLDKLEQLIAEGIGVTRDPRVVASGDLLSKRRYITQQRCTAASAPKSLGRLATSSYQPLDRTDRCLRLQRCWLTVQQKACFDSGSCLAAAGQHDEPIVFSTRSGRNSRAWTPRFPFPGDAVDARIRCLLGRFMLTLQRRKPVALTRMDRWVGLGKAANATKKLGCVPPDLPSEQMLPPCKLCQARASAGKRCGQGTGLAAKAVAAQ